MNAPYFEDYNEQWSYETETAVVTDEDITAFVELHKFYTPTFTDMNYVKNSADYGARMAPGLFGLCTAEGLVLRAGLTSKRGIFLMELTPKFLKPVFAGDTLRNRVRMHSKKLTSKPDRGVVVTAHEVVNQKGEVVISYLSTRMIRTRAFKEAPASAA